MRRQCLGRRRRAGAGAGAGAGVVQCARGGGRGSPIAVFFDHGGLTVGGWTNNYTRIYIHTHLCTIFCVDCFIRIFVLRVPVLLYNLIHVDSTNSDSLATLHAAPDGLSTVSHDATHQPAAATASLLLHAAPDGLERLVALPHVVVVVLGGGRRVVAHLLCHVVRVGGPLHEGATHPVQTIVVA